MASVGGEGNTATGELKFEPCPELNNKWPGFVPSLVAWMVEGLKLSRRIEEPGDDHSETLNN